jgi:hypothetical protein
MKEYIKTEDLMKHLKETRKSLMSMSKKMSPKEFYMKDSMLLNFMQTVNLMAQDESEAKDESIQK